MNGGATFRESAWHGKFVDDSLNLPHKSPLTGNLFAVVAWLWLLVGSSLASKILIIVPSPSISHQKPFQILTKALLERGHEVTFFTTDPLKLPHENLTEIDLSVAYKIVQTLDLVAMAKMSPLDTLTILRDPAKVFVPWQLSEPAVQDFIRKNHTFDLAILELMAHLSYFGLIHRVGSPPLIGMMSLSAFAPVYYTIGNPMNPAYVPEVWVGFSDHMSFWERAYNAYFYLQFYYMWYYQTMPSQEAIMREYFGPDVPSIYDMQRNLSLLIVNNHFTQEYARPHLPNVVELTGIHVETRNKPLPKDIQKFMDGAEEGVIYFSLGSNVRSNALPLEKIQAFLEAFGELPQRVLWKFENDTLPGQPPNVMIRKWLPQQDVLAHPKVRLFITQGGLQSMNEATYHAVPFLVIPFFSDQAHNAAKIKTAEIGIKMEFDDVTKENLLTNLRAILQDKKYKDNMKRLSVIFREHKADSVDRAVWWIEYVIRHNGAPHLRSAALDLYWWQLLLLDVIGFVLVSVLVVSYITWYLLRHLATTVRKYTRKEKKE